MRKLMSLALALVMSLALAAPAAAVQSYTECINCGVWYTFALTIDSKPASYTILESYGVEEIPELRTTELYKVDSGNYCTEEFCPSCTDKIAQAYLAALRAANISSSGSNGTVPVKINADASTFSVTVPTSIPLNVDANAAVTCADNLKIINNSAGPVEVTGISVQNNAWSIVSFNGGNRSSLASEKVNSNKLGLALTPDGGTQIATSDGGTQNLTLEDGEWVIPAGGNLPFECAGIATAVSASASNIQAAKVVFTLAWNSGATSSGTTSSPASWFVIDDECEGVLYGLSSEYDAETCGTDIVIPSEIDGITVTCIGSEAFIQCDFLTSITIPDSVICIEEGAFKCCYSITNITIPDSVTSIRANAFLECTSLTSAIIGNSVTSIDSGTFSECGNLTSITIPSSVTYIDDYAFEDCFALTTVNYTGTEEQWSDIMIGSYGNDYLTSAFINYNYAG